MRRSYELPEMSEGMETCAQKIVQTLVESGLSYKLANAVLERAQDLLEGTKPNAICPI